MINKNSPVPIYHQLEEYIKQQIETGILKEEAVIPSEREYAERFQISRMTVRQAINNLVSEGYLKRQKEEVLLSIGKRLNRSFRV